MAVSIKARRFATPMDPHEVLDHALDCTGLVEVEAGERVAAGSVVLTVAPEALLLGLQIGTGAMAPKLEANRDEMEDTMVKFWVSFAPEAWADPAFDGAGADCAIELYFRTTSYPARWRERTSILQVQQL